MTAKAERRVFFSIAGIVCKALLCGAMGSMLFVGAGMVASRAGAGHAVDIVPVSADAVLADIPGTQSENDGSEAQSSADIDVPNALGIKIPGSLNAVLTSDTTSQRVLNSWLDVVPERDRRAFIAGLAKVVAAADQHCASWEWDNRQRYVAAAMSEYARINIDHITEVVDARKRSAEKLIRYRDALGTLLGIAGTLTLLLTVMAIERNTRPRVAVGPASSCE